MLESPSLETLPSDSLMEVASHLPSLKAISTLMQCCKRFCSLGNGSSYIRSNDDSESTLHSTRVQGWLDSAIPRLVPPIYVYLWHPGFQKDPKRFPQSILRSRHLTGLFCVQFHDREAAEFNPQAKLSDKLIDLLTTLRKNPDLQYLSLFNSKGPPISPRRQVFIFVYYG